MTKQLHEGPPDSLAPATESPLDRALVDRLNVISAREGNHGECFEPLTRVLVEAAAWLVAAAVLWVAAATYALR